MEIKEREKALIKNTGILALGTLCSKVFSFFLLPLYTALLTTEDYGTVDVLQTVSSFAMPFITLQLCSGIFRFIIEKKKNEDWIKIITTGTLIEVINVFIFSVIVVIVDSQLHIQYCGLFILYFASMALLEIVQNIIRGFGDNTLYSIMSFVMTLVSLVSNLVMILGMGMKGNSILIASSLAYLAASLLGIYKRSLWKYFHIQSFSTEALKEMIKYCLPLIPNAISWWIANTSDRLLIRYFLGAGENGIYAAANKIPTIYTTIFNVYNIAWIEALSRSVGDKKQEDFINSMFEKSLRLFGCICLGIISCMGIFFNILIGESYRDAYPHVYILMIAIFFNSVCSFLGGIFTAFKRSDVIGKTTIWGAVINFFVNLVLINFVGLYAASLSTLVSYVVIVWSRTKNARKLMNLIYPKKYLMELSIMLFITTLGYFSKNYLANILILCLLFVWSHYSNRELINTIVKSAWDRIKRGWNGN